MLLSTAPLLIEYCSDMLMLIKELVISSNAAKNEHFDLWQAIF